MGRSMSAANDEEWSFQVIPSGGVAEVDQGVGATLAVLGGAAGAGEAHGFVEADRLGILFVDVGGERGVEREGVVDQAAADALAAPCGVDEQRLHMRAVDQHEADGAVVGIGGEPGGGLGQEGGDLRLYRDAV